MNFAALSRLIAYFSALVGLLFSSFSRADSTAAVAAAPQPARLRFLFLDESAGYYALKLPGGEYRQLSANPYEISSPYLPPSDATGLELFKVSTDSDPATGQPLRVKIATLPAPRGIPSALVVVTPRPPTAPGAPLDFRTEIINCDPASFPPGAIRIVNRGRVPMAAQFGGEQSMVAPGESKVVVPTCDARHRVLFKIAALEAPGWRLVSDNLTVIRPPARVFGIFVYSPGGMRHTRTPEEIAEFGPPPPGHFWLTFSDTP